MNFEERDFVDRMGLLFDQMGAGRAAGRVIGWLLISEPEHQSSQQLAERLMMSKGAVSTVTRSLVDAGLIERVFVQGERSSYFRSRSEGWVELMSARMRLVHHMIAVADDGLKAIRGAPPGRRARLQEFRDFYAFMEREFPALIEKFKKEVR